MISLESNSVFFKRKADYERDCRIPAQPFPFLRLPADLRNQVYDLIFFCNPRFIDNDRWSGLRAQKPSPYEATNEHSFLRVCRQVYEETHRYLYHQISIVNLSSLARFLGRIGDHVQDICSIRVEAAVGGTVLKLDHLLAARSLQRITIGILGIETQRMKTRIVIMLGRWVRLASSSCNTEMERLLREQRFAGIAILPSKSNWMAEEKARFRKEVAEEMLGQIRKAAGLPEQ